MPKHVKVRKASGAERCEVCCMGADLERPLLASVAPATVWYAHAECFREEYGEEHPMLKAHYDGDGFIVEV